MRLSKESLALPKRFAAAAIITGALLACDGNEDKPEPIVKEEPINSSIICDSSSGEQITEEVFLPQGKTYLIDGTLVTPAPGRVHVEDVETGDGLTFVSSSPSGEAGVRITNENTGRRTNIKATPLVRDEANGMLLSVEVFCE